MYLLCIMDCPKSLTNMNQCQNNQLLVLNTIVKEFKTQVNIRWRGNYYDNIKKDWLRDHVAWQGLLEEEETPSTNFRVLSTSMAPFSKFIFSKID